jgi:hypothetical protein
LRTIRNWQTFAVSSVENDSQLAPPSERLFSGPWAAISTSGYPEPPATASCPPCVRSGRMAGGFVLEPMERKMNPERWTWLDLMIVVIVLCMILGPL